MTKLINMSNEKFAVQVSSIANNIVNNATSNVLVVTGAKEGVGTTSIVMGVANSLSRYKKVCVVEANFVSPCIAHELSIDGNGLAELLVEIAEINQVIKKIDDNLYVIPAGNITIDSNINLLNGKIKTSLDKLIEDGYFVLIDTPALSKCNDGVDLAVNYKEIALVVGARTSRKLLVNAINMIDIASINLVGLIINKKKKK